jgi:hypothetical protein
MPGNASAAAFFWQQWRLGGSLALPGGRATKRDAEVVGVRLALQSIRFCRSTRDLVTLGRPLMELAARSEYLCRLRYCPHWLDNPTLPLDDSSAVWISLSRLRWSRPCSQFRPLFELRSPLEYQPAKPSRPAAARQLLSWASLPFSTSGTGGSPAAGFPSPATFRLQGLATLLTAYSLRARAGFVSHRRRSWDSPFGAFPSRKVSGALPPESTHVPFSLPAYPPPKRKVRPEGRGFWAFTLSRVPRGLVWV